MTLELGAVSREKSLLHCCNDFESALRIESFEIHLTEHGFQLRLELLRKTRQSRTRYIYSISAWNRRLQLPHEGSLMKTLYAHLQTMEWIVDPVGLKYYACSSAVGPADRAALQTVATHSITTVLTTPQKAVDEIFAIDTFQEAERVWQEILGS